MSGWPVLVPCPCPCRLSSQYDTRSRAEININARARAIEAYHPRRSQILPDKGINNNQAGVNINHVCEGERERNWEQQLSGHMIICSDSSFIPLRTRYLGTWALARLFAKGQERASANQRRLSNRRQPHSLPFTAVTVCRYFRNRLFMHRLPSAQPRYTAPCDKRRANSLLDIAASTVSARAMQLYCTLDPRSTFRRRSSDCCTSI